MTSVLWIIVAFIILFGFVVFRGAPYVPSKRSDISRAFEELYKIGKNDTLVDIGSGDGIVLREAAKRGATAVGYELNPLLVLISRWLSRKEPSISVHLADFWYAQLPESTTVVYTFGDSRDINKMATKVADVAARQGRPLMFISYAFAVKDLIPVKQVGAHYLYRIEPLQSMKA